jgi:hypothetical protein
VAFFVSLVGSPDATPELHHNIQGHHYHDVLDSPAGRPSGCDDVHTTRPDRNARNQIVMLHIAALEAIPRTGRRCGSMLIVMIAFHPGLVGAG